MSYFFGFSFGFGQILYFGINRSILYKKFTVISVNAFDKISHTVPLLSDTLKRNSQMNTLIEDVCTTFQVTQHPCSATRHFEKHRIFPRRVPNVAGS